MQPKMCSSILSQSLGLMFQKPKPLLMKLRKEKKCSIHTWFMKGTIDVYWLDKNKNVLEKKTMKPWQYHTPKHAARYVLELPAGTRLTSIKMSSKF